MLETTTVTWVVLDALSHTKREVWFVCCTLFPEKAYTISSTLYTAVKYVYTVIYTFLYGVG